MNSRKEHLDLAIAQAKQRLSDLGAATKLPEEKTNVQSKGKPPQSRLNRLLGKRSVPDTRKSTLLQRVGVVERPTYGLVADAVLGKESRVHQPTMNLHSDDGSLASIVSTRLRSLRERTAVSIEEQHQPVDEEDFFVGVETDGRPVWESVLD